MAVQTRMTAAQFDALPEEEGCKWELLDGELIEVSSATPKHNLILARLLSLLYSYVVPRRLGVVLPETDLAVRDNTRLRPDLGVFSAETWRSVDIERTPIAHSPDIAVEIISPSETAAMVNRKVQAYLEHGVQEVWLIYPETRMMEVQSESGCQRLTEGASLVSDLVPGWRIQVAELFEDL